MASILTDIKKMLALPEEVKDFDQDLVIFINAAFSNLQQLGVGPEDGYAISDDADRWDDFITGPKFNDVKTYIFLNVRILFDPPTVGTVMNAYKAQLDKLEWLLNVKREEDKWYQENPTHKF